MGFVSERAGTGDVSLCAGTLEGLMSNYSIEKVGSDYVVKVDDQSVMKVGSRRRAAQLVVDASELLNDVPLMPAEAPSSVDLAMPGDAPSVADHAAAGDIVTPSITRDSPEVA
jgi:hypothetical protein